MKQDSYAALLAAYTRELRAVREEICEWTKSVRTRAADYVSPLTIVTERLAARTAYEHTQMQRARCLQRKAESLKRILQQNNSELEYPFLQTYMSCCGRDLLMQDIALLYLSEPTAERYTEFRIAAEFQQFATFLYQNPTTLLLLTQQLSSYRRVGVLTAFMYAYETQFLDIRQPEVRQFLPTYSLIDSYIPYIVFSAVCKTLLSVRRLADFPGFYIQRSRNHLGLLTDMLHAIQACDSVRRYTENYLCAALAKLQMFNYAYFRGLAFLQSAAGGHEVVFMLRELLSGLSRNLPDIADAPELIKTAFASANFALQQFCAGLFANPYFGYHYLDAETFSSASELHLFLFRRFHIAFFFGVLVRDAVFQHGIDAKFAGNTVFLVDVLLSGQLGDLFSQQLSAADSGAKLYGLSYYIATQIAPELQLCLNLTQYHRWISSPESATEYILQVPTETQYALLGRLRACLPFREHIAQGILLSTRRLLRELFDAFTRCSQELDAGLSRLASLARYILRCCVVDGSYLPQMVQLQSFRDEAQNLQSFRSLNISESCGQGSEILLVQLGKSFFDKPKLFEMERERSRESCEMEQIVQEMRADLGNAASRLPAVIEYQTNCRIFNKFAALQEKVTAVINQESYATAESEAQFLERYQANQAAINQLIAEYQALREESSRADQYFTGLYGELHALQAIRQRIEATTENDSQRQPKAELDDAKFTAFESIKARMNDSPISRTLESYNQFVSGLTGDSQQGQSLGVYKSLFGVQKSGRSYNSALFNMVMYE